jgi:hypothetical protein
MGFRFQKRIRLFKGLTLNLSKTGTSWTIGGRGASINLRDGENASKTLEPIEKQSSSELVTVILVIALIAFGYFLGKIT